MPKVGPDNRFPFGAPAWAGDRGGLYAGLRAFPEKRAMLMYFGTVLNTLSTPPMGAKKMAEQMRGLVEKHWGKLDYRVDELPMRVWADREKTMVFTGLAQMVEGIAANPELFLAWAQRLDEAADQLLSS